MWCVILQTFRDDCQGEEYNEGEREDAVETEVTTCG